MRIKLLLAILAFTQIFSREIEPPKSKLPSFLQNFQLKDDCMIYKILMGISIVGNIGLGIDSIFSHTKISEYEKTIKSLTEAIKPLREMVNSLKKLVEEQQLKIARLTKENEELKKLYNDANKTIQELKKTVEEQQQAIKNLQDVIEYLNNLMNELRKELREKTDQILDLLNQLKEKEDIILQKDLVIMEQSQTIEFYKAKTLEQEEVIANLTNQLENLRQTIIYLRSVISEKEEVINYWKTESNNKDKIIEEKNAKIANLTADNEALKKKLLEKEEEIKNKDIKIEEQKRTIDTLTKENTDLKAENKEVKEKLEKSNLQIYSLSQDWLKLHILEANNHSVELTKKWDSSMSQCATKEFHEIAKNSQKTVFLAHDKQKNYVFGGYANEAFDGSDEYGHDVTAFTFSLNSTKKCVMKKDAKNSIYKGIKLDANDVLLEYGNNYEILLKPNCLAQKHLINARNTYDCPESEIANFYTEEKEPELTLVELFEVTVKQFGDQQ